MVLAMTRPFCCRRSIGVASVVVMTTGIYRQPLACQYHRDILVVMMGGRVTMKKAAKEAQLGVVTLLGCRCRCGHEWLPRNRDDDGAFERPAVCPTCKSPLWDRP